MKRLAVFVFFVLGIIVTANSQVLTGTAVDALSGEPIPYINAGIAGKGVGVVSDSKGRFSIKADAKYFDDTLRVSCIGYEPIEIRVSDYISGAWETVGLRPAETAIEEVVVRPGEYRTKILGNRYRGNTMSLVARDSTRGFECGVLVKIRKRALLEEVNINVRHCRRPDTVFRINIYKATGNMNFENILTVPVYAYCPRTDSLITVTVDLRPYRIIVEGNTFVTFEHIDEGESTGFVFPAGIVGASTYYRSNAQSEWTSHPLKFPISVTALVER